MAYVVPGWDLKDEDKKKFREMCSGSLITRALGLGIARALDELTIRDVRAQDVGLTSWKFSGLEGWNQWIKHYIVPTYCVLSFYKFVQTSFRAGATEIKFGSFANTRAIHNLEGCYSGTQLPTVKDIIRLMEAPEVREVLGRMTDDTDVPLPQLLGRRAEGWFTEPIMYDPNMDISVELKCNPNTEDNIVLVGFVVERRGQTIC